MLSVEGVAHCLSTPCGYCSLDGLLFVDSPDAFLMYSLIAISLLPCLLPAFSIYSSIYTPSGDKITVSSFGCIGNPENFLPAALLYCAMMTDKPAADLPDLSDISLKLLEHLSHDCQLVNSRVLMQAGGQHQGIG